MSFAPGRDCEQVCGRHQSDGERGRELVCVLDQATDDLKHQADAHVLIQTPNAAAIAGMGQQTRAHGTGRYE